MSSRVHDIVNGLMIAHAHAELFLEEKPDDAAAAKKLMGEIKRIRDEFVSAVHGEKL